MHSNFKYIQFLDAFKNMFTRYVKNHEYSDLK